MIARAKACPSHRCDINMQGKLADDLSTFVKVFHSEFLFENTLQNLNGVADFILEKF